MIVIDIRSGEFSHRFSSHQLLSPERILLSACRHFMVTIQPDHVSIWRMEIVTSPAPYERYLADDAKRFDDEHESEETYYDDYEDMERRDITQQTVRSYNLLQCSICFWFCFFKIVLMRFWDLWAYDHIGAVSRSCCLKMTKSKSKSKLSSPLLEHRPPTRLLQVRLWS